MNCEQKSGVFLNISCNNTIEETCSNCKKEVCKTHAFKSKLKTYCEDCYWENYFYVIEDKDTYSSYNDVFVETSNSPTVFTSNDETPSPTGFEDGFGGGSFGGGGAGGSWTEGEMQSLADDTNNEIGGGLLSSDDTFFYS